MFKILIIVTTSAGSVSTEVISFDEEKLAEQAINQINDSRLPYHPNQPNSEVSVYVTRLYKRSR